MRKATGLFALCAAKMNMPIYMPMRATIILAKRVLRKTFRIYGLVNDAFVLKAF